MQFEFENTPKQDPGEQPPSGGGRFAKFIGGRGFYMALLVCLAAVGALAFVLTSGTSPEVAELETSPPDGQQVQLIPDGGLAQQASPASTPGASPSSTPATSSTPTVKLALPVEGEVAKQYNTQDLLYSATLKEWTVHHGLDIAALSGTNVKSALAGTVETARDDPEYGLCVTIAHADNSRTLYGNLDAIGEGIQAGTEVQQGSVLGRVGSSAPVECKDPAHLHFEYIVNGESVDPLQYMNGIAGTTAAPDGIK